MSWRQAASVVVVGPSAARVCVAWVVSACPGAPGVVRRRFPAPHNLNALHAFGMAWVWQCEARGTAQRPAGGRQAGRQAGSQGNKER